MKQLRPHPQVVITKKGARQLASGHPWVFEGEVLSLAPAPTDGHEAQNGCLVDVVEENGTWHGAGLLSQNSKIRVRIITRNANDRMDAAFWQRKIAWAWEYRETTMGPRSLAGCEPDTTCCRVIFSEADGFPGLVVDRFEDVLVAQVGTVGMHLLRPTIYPLLLGTLAAAGQDVRALYERNDFPSRAKEGLPLEKGWYDFLAPGAISPGAAALLADDVALAPPPASTRIFAEEGGLRFEIDVAASQKTGYFLDQKYNRRAVRTLARGRRVLDCFCHVGPFGLSAAAGGAEFVRCVDSSRTALELAQQNARLNNLEPAPGGGARVAFTRADVLQYLPKLVGDRRFARQEGGPFDLVVLDPPAFAKDRASLRGARRGYREINYQALRLLPRGGYLATCSCSRIMNRDLLAGVVADAAHAANVQLRQVEERQQAPDHPILWGAPETHYLDFFIFQVV